MFCSSGFRPSLGPRYLGSVLHPETFLGGSAVTYFGREGTPALPPLRAVWVFMEKLSRTGRKATNAEGGLVPRTLLRDVP